MTIGANQALVAADHLVCHNPDGSPKPNIARLTGEFMWYPVATPPSGWLLCNGQAVSRTTYAALFALIGTSFGVGDGSTTFNLPDMQGRVPVAVGTHADVNALNKNDGLALANRTPKHTHSETGHTHTVNTQGTFATVSPAAGAQYTPSGLVIQNGQMATAGGSGASGLSNPAYLVIGYVFIKT